MDSTVNLANSVVHIVSFYGNGFVLLVTFVIFI